MSAPETTCSGAERTHRRNWSNLADPRERLSRRSLCARHLDRSCVPGPHVRSPATELRVWPRKRGDVGSGHARGAEQDPAPGGVLEQNSAVCPQCGNVASVEWRDVAGSTSGPVEHVKIRCLGGHRFLMLAERLTLVPEASADARPEQTRAVRVA